MDIAKLSQNLTLCSNGTHVFLYLSKNYLSQQLAEVQSLTRISQLRKKGRRDTMKKIGSSVHLGVEKTAFQMQWQSRNTLLRLKWEHIGLWWRVIQWQAFHFFLLRRTYSDWNVPIFWFSGFQHSINSIKWLNTFIWKTFLWFKNSHLQFLNKRGNVSELLKLNRYVEIFLQEVLLKIWAQLILVTSLFSVKYNQNVLVFPVWNDYWLLKQCWLLGDNYPIAGLSAIPKLLRTVHIFVPEHFGSILLHLKAS